MTNYYYFEKNPLKIDFSYISDHELCYLIGFFGRGEKEFFYDKLELSLIFEALKNLCIDENAARRRNQGGKVVNCDLLFNLLSLDAAELLAMQNISKRMASKPGDRHYFGESLSMLFDEVEITDDVTTA